MSNPKYPLYVISKGRWDSRYTVKALEAMNVPYSLVIEPQEYDNYARVVDENKLLVLPFSDVGSSIPARNFVWEHSMEKGFEKHWIVDDNIRAFFRSNRNKRHYVSSGVTLKAMEDFTDRYENVALSGPNYTMFVLDDSDRIPAFYLNTRIYSCILIRNDIPHKWRGRYNEDTDLSLRALKDGWCTILFNAFPVEKTTTMTMKGGNTDSLYQGDGRKKMAESLREQHPDVVSVRWKFNRWHHHVDYSPFKENKLIKKDIEIPQEPNEYGMELVFGDEKDKFLELKNQF